jgi:hypothetical protein
VALDVQLGYCASSLCETYTDVMGRETSGRLNCFVNTINEGLGLASFSPDEGKNEA